MWYTRGVADNGAHDTRCSGCGGNVDPLRAAHVALFDATFHYFCSTACKQTFLAGHAASTAAETAVPATVHADSPSLPPPPLEPAVAALAVAALAVAEPVFLEAADDPAAQSPKPAHAPAIATAAAKAALPTSPSADKWLAMGGALLASVGFALVLAPASAHRVRWPLTLVAAGLLFGALANVRARRDVALASLPLAVLVAAARSDQPGALTTGSLVAAAAITTAALAMALLVSGLWPRPERVDIEPPPWRALDLALGRARIAALSAAAGGFVISYASSRVLGDAVVIAASCALAASVLTVRALAERFERSTTHVATHATSVAPRMLESVDTLVVEESALATELEVGRVQTWGVDRSTVLALAREHLTEPRVANALRDVDPNPHGGDDAKLVACAGTRDHLTAARISVARAESWATAQEEDGMLVRFVAVDERVVGCIAFQRRAQTDLRTALESLRREHVEVVLFSEESSVSAHAFARAFAIELVRADRVHQDRDETARALVEEGRSVAWLAEDPLIASVQALAFAPGEHVGALLDGVAASQRATRVGKHIWAASSAAGAFAALALGVGLLPAYAAAGVMAMVAIFVLRVRS